MSKATAVLLPLYHRLLIYSFLDKRKLLDVCALSKSEREEITKSNLLTDVRGTMSESKLSQQIDKPFALQRLKFAIKFCAQLPIHIDVSTKHHFS